MPEENKKRGFTTLIKDFESANILQAEAGTNGYVDGDNGTFTYIRLENLGGTQWDIELGKDKNALELRLTGGTELQTIIAALDFISSTLKNQYGLKGN